MGWFNGRRRDVGQNARVFCNPAKARRSVEAWWIDGTAKQLAGRALAVYTTAPLELLRDSAAQQALAAFMLKEGNRPPPCTAQISGLGEWK